MRPYPSKKKNCIHLIKKRYPNHFEIKEEYFREIALPNSDTAQHKQIQKALRWLIPYEEFARFGNIYSGDVDFLIVKETPSLLEGHLHHCKTTNLPFSNAVRPATRRLTGLHFIKVKPYYAKMNPIINYYLSHIAEVSAFVEKGKGNEEFLYEMIEKGIGFNGLEKLRFRPHHGFHLGCISYGTIKPGYLGYTETPTNDKVKTSSFDLMKPKLAQYFHDPLFLDIMESIPDNKLIILANKVIGSTKNIRLANLMSKK